MGLLLDKLYTPRTNNDSTIYAVGSSGDADSSWRGFFRRQTKKRKLEADEKSEESSAKIIKLDTSKYIYENLFVNGKYSDVTITALDHRWNLHRAYLEQCEYFRAAFNPAWSNSVSQLHELQIIDENITYEGYNLCFQLCIYVKMSLLGLNSVFASLYQNEISFALSDISGILAAASLLGLVRKFASAWWVKWTFSMFV